MRMNFSVGMGRNLSMHEIARHAIVAEENGFREITLLISPIYPEMYMR